MKKNKQKQKVSSLNALEQINLNAAGIDIGAEEIYVAIPQGRDENSVRIIGMGKMGAVLSERLCIKLEQADLREIFVERWAENDPRAYLASMRAQVGWSVADQLHKLTMPVLIIAAEEDYEFIGDKAAYLDRTPNAELVIIEDSRHGTPVEHPEKFNKLVFDFLL